jgi:hypothetical protein
MVDSPLRIRNGLSTAQAAFGTIKWSVVDQVRGPLLRDEGGWNDALQLSCR